MQAGGDYSWDPPARVWRKYDEKTGLWSKDASRETVLNVSDVCLTAYRKLGHIVAQDMRDHPPATKNDMRLAEMETLVARQKQLNSSTYFKQVAELAGMEPGGSRPAPEYDRARHLLACENGVFDFEKMVLRPFQRSDALTVSCAAKYVDDAECPRFDEFLARAFAGDEELIAYWWRIVGYSLTGYVDHDALFFCYGAGANGKSTAMLALRMLLGSGLSSTIESHALLTDRPDSTVAYQKASLEGKRMILTDELPEGKRLNESMVKALIGGDNIQARRPYQEPYDFAPTHKIWMIGNHKPRIAGTDLGIWRRIHLIPWLVTVPPEERRPRHELLAAFRGELSGILWAALHGYNDFLTRGKKIDPPKAVTDATEEYRQEEDTLGQFIADVLTPCQGAFVEVRDLFKKYGEWCEATGEKPTVGTANKMTRALKKSPGMNLDRGTDGTMTLFNYAWHG
jgi:putative DNA primase/helicase